ncbi:MAG: class II SORL domain-containing protein [Kiritimatiellae bacterium]|nr:class II SORL domain-containing protein [Kiritimatiellia bacterium]
MPALSETIQRADWKSEKHVPVIECPESVKPDQLFDVTVSVGQVVGHPNTTEHHIRWIMLCFHPEGEKAVFQAGRFEFTAHGESVKGANQGPVSTHHKAAATLKLLKSGTLQALAYCNIHGLWESSREIRVK